MDPHQENSSVAQLQNLLAQDEQALLSRQESERTTRCTSCSPLTTTLIGAHCLCAGLTTGLLVAHYIHTHSTQPQNTTEFLVNNMN